MFTLQRKGVLDSTCISSPVLNKLLLGLKGCPFKYCKAKAMKASGGFRSGTRRKLASAKRAKFKVEKHIQEFRPDQRVVIRQDPSSHSGMPHPRFKGMTGVVKVKRGRSYIVVVRSGKKVKEIAAKPEHLKGLSG